MEPEYYVEDFDASEHELKVKTTTYIWFQMAGKSDSWFSETTTVLRAGAGIDRRGQEEAEGAAAGGDEESLRSDSVCPVGLPRGDGSSGGHQGPPLWMHRGPKSKVISVANLNQLVDLQVCHAGRSGLGQASREFTASSLGILSAYRRRQQAKRLLNDLNIIRTLVSQTGAK